MWNYLLFKKMIMPIIIQIIFWGLSALCVAAGIYIAIVRLNPAKGIAIALLSPLIIRIACEIIMVFFRIHQTLLNIEKKLALPDARKAVEINQPIYDEGHKETNKPLFDIITGDKKNNNPVNTSS